MRVRGSQQKNESRGAGAPMPPTHPPGQDSETPNLPWAAEVQAEAETETQAETQRLRERQWHRGRGGDRTWALSLSLHASLGTNADAVPQVRTLVMRMV